MGQTPKGNTNTVVKFVKTRI